jgi:ABC-type sulfate transport system permease component
VYFKSILFDCFICVFAFNATCNLVSAGYHILIQVIRNSHYVRLYRVTSSRVTEAVCIPSGTLLAWVIVSFMC